MIKSRKFIALTAIMITLCASTALIGCGNKSQTQTKTDSSAATDSTKDSTQGATADKSAAGDKGAQAGGAQGAPDGAQAGGGLGGPTAINTQGATKYWTDVAYASTSDTEKLDIYLPNTGDGPFPVIISFHGGGFALGDKNSGESNDPLVGLTHGYAVVCVNYRLSSEATFPAAVYDAKAAVRFIKANASKYNLNADKIAAWGDSAGGNLASLLGTSAGTSSLEDLSMGNSDKSSNVQAVVDLYGPINFSTMDEEFKKDGKDSSATHNSADSFESKYMGAALDTVPDKVQQANPTKYISSSTPPFFVENGSADTNVPTVQSVDFSNALKKAIGDDKVTYIQIPGAGHGTSEFDTTENLDKIFTFLDKYLK